MRIPVVCVILALSAGVANAQVEVPAACRGLAAKDGYPMVLSKEQAERAKAALDAKDPTSIEVKRCRIAVEARVRKAMEKASNAALSIQ